MLTLPMKAGKKVLRPRTSTNFSQFGAPASDCMAYERTLIALVLASNFSLIYVRYDTTLGKSDSLH
jgi:hypothetical protein